MSGGLRRLLAWPSFDEARRICHDPAVRGATLIAVVVLVAGCGDSSAKRSILGDAVQPVSYVQLRSDIDVLYRDHPDVGRYAVRQVEYTPTTRDKVLRVCHLGAQARTAQQKEATRVYACAPLIFFFYRYGREHSVPSAVQLAQRLYWYGARVTGPFDAQTALEDILHRWGVR
jgi:hypothetical protein